MTGERWPNLFVVGAGKAGTTSLWSYLDQHPEIYMSPVKEPHFFSSYEPRLAPLAKDEASYLSLFAGATTEKLRGEASVSYLWDKQAAGAIKRVSPEARIVIALREPVARAYSSYWFFVRYGAERRPFLDAIEAELAIPRRLWADRCRYVGRGLYCDGVRRFRSLFGGRVHLIFYEELAADARREMARLYERLDVDPDVAQRIEIDVHNPTSLPRNALAGRLVRSDLVHRAGRRIVPRSLRPRLESALLTRVEKPEMDDRARRALTEAYRPEVERLRQLVGRPLPW